jgi:hypothetical protein
MAFLVRTKLRASDTTPIPEMDLMEKRKRFLAVDCTRECTTTYTVLLRHEMKTNIAKQDRV